jgi:hypothetical protein
LFSFARQHKNVKNIETIANAALRGILIENNASNENVRIIAKLYNSDFKEVFSESFLMSKGLF